MPDDSTPIDSTPDDSTPIKDARAASRAAVDAMTKDIRTIEDSSEEIRAVFDAARAAGNAAIGPDSSEEIRAAVNSVVEAAVNKERNRTRARQTTARQTRTPVGPVGRARQRTRIESAGASAAKIASAVKDARAALALCAARFMYEAQIAAHRPTPADDYTAEYEIESWTNHLKEWARILDREDRRLDRAERMIDSTLEPPRRRRLAAVNRAAAALASAITPPDQRRRSLVVLAARGSGAG